MKRTLGKTYGRNTLRPSNRVRKILIVFGLVRPVKPARYPLAVLTTFDSLDHTDQRRLIKLSLVIALQWHSDKIRIMILM